MSYGGGENETNVASTELNGNIDHNICATNDITLNQVNPSQIISSPLMHQQQHREVNSLQLPLSTQDEVVNHEMNVATMLPGNRLNGLDDDSMTDALLLSMDSTTFPTSATSADAAPATPTTGAENAGSIITLMQSSPPPHSYRHSRAYRHFKNPPQPHMCIRTTTDAGEELFINVLSWTRIVIPQEPSDPIPLYGGMRVPPGSPRSPPIVFAVMANPEVLKDSGRHSKDPEERRAMVELMCDFVEAMNPGVKLVRNAVILKDRDISGELKDVWNAVQAQRDREREEQMLQQRQQQHYHNITTQQMFPKAADAAASSMSLSANIGLQPHLQVQQQLSEDGSLKEISIDSEMNAQISTNATGSSGAQFDVHSDIISNNVDAQNTNATTEQLVANIDTASAEKRTQSDDDHNPNARCTANHVAIVSSSLDSTQNERITAHTVKQLNGNNENVNNSSIGNGSSDQIDASNKSDRNAKSDHALVAIKAQHAGLNANHASDNRSNNNKKAITTAATPATSPTNTNTPASQVEGNASLTPTSTSAQMPSLATFTTAAASNKTATTITTTNTAITAPQPPATAKATATNSTAPTKKEKLGGFLPNGCIFPRFKNSKNKDKDKDKDKDKEPKSKDKEKTLLNALKKSKEKKVAPSEQIEKSNATVDATADAKSQYERNCINLENEVQKLDLNKIDTTPGSDNMFFKLKMSSSSSSSATAK